MLDKTTPILLIGFGSIGKRHCTNLKTLGFNNLTVFDPLAFVNKQEQVKRIEKLDLNTVRDFRIAFICSPNHLHVKHATLCAQAGCHLFIEKPLMHKRRGAAKLIQICKRNKIISMVGCNLRFHPCLVYIKRQLERKAFGRVCSIRLEFGAFLPSWRKTDYRKNYAASRAMGGGIILDDIHDFDLLFWLNDFTPLLKSSFIYEKVGSLKIDTEDMCLASFLFKNKVLGSVVCDYLQRKRTRTCKIITDDWNITWDWHENIVRRESDKVTKILYASPKFETNDMYVDELRYFFKALEKKSVTLNTVAMAYAVTNILPTLDRNG